MRTTERKKIDAALPDVYEAVKLFLDGRIDEAMNRYNASKETQE